MIRILGGGACRENGGLGTGVAPWSTVKVIASAWNGDAGVSEQSVMTEGASVSRRPWESVFMLRRLLED